MYKIALNTLKSFKNYPNISYLGPFWPLTKNPEFSKISAIKVPNPQVTPSVALLVTTKRHKLNFL